MRRIAEVDAAATYWRDDILEFEKQRIVELVHLGQQASRNGDHGLLRQAVQEYETEKWLGEPPAAFVERYGTLARELHERETLPALASAIAQAAAALDVAGLSNLRNQWNAVTGKLMHSQPSWSPPQQFRSAVYPAFEYLDQQILLSTTVGVSNRTSLCCRQPWNPTPVRKRLPSIWPRPSRTVFPFRRSYWPNLVNLDVAREVPRYSMWP